MKLRRGNFLYINEHLCCKNYLMDINTGFKYMEFLSGTSFNEEKIVGNIIFIFIEGEVLMSHQQFQNRSFKSGDMILLSSGTDVECHFLAHTKLLVFSFEVIKSSCDLFLVQSYFDLCKSVNYDFTPVSIKPPLDLFCKLLLSFLENGMNCAHLHEMKHKEFFMLLRGYYTKEEVVCFLYPIIGRSLTFREMVVQNYKGGISVSELAECCNMSLTVFREKFKENFDLSPKSWLHQQNRQKILMKAGAANVTISDLMECLNFSSSTAFNNYCIRMFNCTPKELIARQHAII